MQGAVLGLIVLFGVGYLRFNIGVDEFYADCRETNDVAVCDCNLEGYTAERNVFTQTPVIGWFVGLSDRAFAHHMNSVRSTCGYQA